MCGIMAVLSRPSQRGLPSAPELVAALESATRELVTPDAARSLTDRLAAARELTGGVDAALRGPVGVAALLGAGGLRERLGDLAAQLESQLAAVERDLDDRLWAWMVATNDPLLDGPVPSPSYRRVMTARGATL